MNFHPALAGFTVQLGSVYEQIRLLFRGKSDRMLDAMGGGQMIAGNMETIPTLREKVRGVAVTADVMVGFRDELDEGFQSSTTALEEVPYHQGFSFKHSRRPMTERSKRVSWKTYAKAKSRSLSGPASTRY